MTNQSGNLDLRLVKAFMLKVGDKSFILKVGVSIPYEDKGFSKIFIKSKH